MKKQIAVCVVVVQVVFLMAGAMAFGENDRFQAMCNEPPVVPEVRVYADETLQSLVDRIEIRHKIGLYNIGWDEGRSVIFDQLYTDDVTFITCNPVKGKPGELVFSAEFPGGLEGQKTRNDNLIVNLRKNGGAMRHVFSEIVFLELAEKTAKTKHTYTSYIWTDIEKEAMAFIGSFNDTWVKTEDKGWVVSERKLIMEHLSPAEAALRDK